MKKNMKTRNGLLIAIGIFVSSAGTVCAGELGHYGAGLPNIRDFFVPEPGFYYVQYRYLYRTDTLKNRNGDEVKSITRTGPLGTTTASEDVDVDVWPRRALPTGHWSLAPRSIAGHRKVQAARCWRYATASGSLSSRDAFGRVNKPWR